MSSSPDRLFDLLPVIYRQRDAEQGWPLRALLQVIGEQVDVVESDIRRLYDNWFIETCEDWVVPYIGDLIGYRPVLAAGEAGPIDSPEGRLLNRRLIPRRELARTIGYRRRKGTLALLEQLGNDVAGWPARAVEFYRLLGINTHVNHVNPGRAHTVGLRDAHGLGLLDGPFDELGHTVDVRRIESTRTRGHSNIPSVGLYVWRLEAFPVTNMPANCAEGNAPHCFTFSVLGNDTPLFSRPQREQDASSIAGRLNVPAPIRRRELKKSLTDYYGDGKSLAIRRGGTLVPAEQIVVADLDRWHYRPLPDTVAVDPERGRLAFPPRHAPKDGLSVSYSYGFSAAMGGGEYSRPLPRLRGSRLYTVGGAAQYKRIGDAVAAWANEKDPPPSAVIEVLDGDVYSEALNIELAANQSLELRAANRVRPVLRLLDFRTDRPDSLAVNGDTGSRFSLDGFLVTTRGVQIGGKLARFTLRHSTLVPGWGLRHDCEPYHPAEPSLLIEAPDVCVTIEHSILGSIQVNLDEVRGDPIRICVSDSILDATSNEREALGAPGCSFAHSLLSLRRSTVFGRIQSHAIELAENSILSGPVKVARRQIGCVRFCWVEPGSRTPRRYECQPNLVQDAAMADGEPEQERETGRVRPRFNSVRYGAPTYCQLADDCAVEITRGADDESEMGAFHDLFQPQREANLTARLEEYMPAGAETALIRAT